MDILDNTITRIKSVVNHNRTVEVVIDYDCYGGIVKDYHCAFRKDKWERIKSTMSFKDGELLDMNDMEYFERMSDDEWHSMRFSAKLKDFSDEEIVDEFNRRIKDTLFHHISVDVLAVVK